MAKKFTKLNLGDVVASVGGKAFRKLSAEEPTSNLISFTIDGVTYQAEEGMTWAEWGANETYTKGDYNVLGDVYVYKSDTGQLVSNNADGIGGYVKRTETIIAEHNYGITPIGN